MWARIRRKRSEPETGSRSIRLPSASLPPQSGDAALADYVIRAGQSQRTRDARVARDSEWRNGRMVRGCRGMTIGRAAATCPAPGRATHEPQHPQYTNPAQAHRWISEDHRQLAEPLRLPLPRALRQAPTGPPDQHIAAGERAAPTRGHQIAPGTGRPAAPAPEFRRAASPASASSSDATRTPHRSACSTALAAGPAPPAPPTRKSPCAAPPSDPTADRGCRFAASRPSSSHTRNGAPRDPQGTPEAPAREAPSSSYPSSTYGAYICRPVSRRYRRAMNADSPCIMNSPTSTLIATTACHRERRRGVTDPAR